VRYDRRGHGKSGVPAGPYNMEMLGRDALAVLDAAKIEKTNWCGLSMGGMVGMWIGATTPQRRRQTDPVEYLGLFREQANLERAHAVREGKRTERSRRRHARTLVHQGLPRA